MLIYNHQKEFIGIDKDDLNTLGFENLEELIAESHDFADLFVKKPGYVHNFKHVNWIDFVACADSTENTKVIIQAKGKSFRSLLEIKTIYLLEDASSKSFLIYLSNMRELIDDENNDTMEHFLEIPLPTPPIPTPVSTSIKNEIEETFFDKPLDIPHTLEIPIAEVVLPSVDFDKSSLEEDLKIDLEELDDTFSPAPQTDTTTMEIFDNGYIFDPHVASDELGLPVDLIEEFIEDFIAQAKEFQKDLYAALDEGDNDNIKILSHKLKGVAANLRIEDALESLTIINQSNSQTEIKNHLDILYKIISKLAGEKILISKNTTINTFSHTQETEDLKLLDIDEDVDLDIFEIQEPQIQIQEDELPIRTSIPELADDNFLKKIDEEIIHNFDTEELNESKDEFLDEVFLDVEDEIKETRTVDYNLESIAREIGLSEENFMELFQDYIEEATNLSDAISNAIKENLPQKWKTKAQQLKGMSDNMRVKDLMKDLQKLIDTQDISIAQEANTEIKTLLIEISKLKG